MATIDDIRDRLEDLSLPSKRSLVIGAAVLVGIVIVAGGVWWWWSAEQERSGRVLATALVAAQSALATTSAPASPAAIPSEGRDKAIRELEDALRRYPAGALAPRASYELGNLKYQQGKYGEARAAYEMAAARAKSESLRTMAKAAFAYSWEADKQFGKAAAAYETLLGSAKGDEFLHDELLVSLARVQERQGKKEEAIKTYRRILENPKSRRQDDVKAQLARLGAQ